MGRHSARCPAKASRRKRHPMSPEVEAARKADLPAIATLNVAAYAEFEQRMTPEGWAGMAASVAAVETVAGRASFLLVRDGGEIAASVAYVPPGCSDVPFPAAWASVLLLAVSPRCKGRGLARALLDSCIARAREDGARIIGLYTSELMTGALRLYESAGFVEDCELARRHGLRYWRYKLTLGQ